MAVRIKGVITNVLPDEAAALVIIWNNNELDAPLLHDFPFLYYFLNESNYFLDDKDLTDDVKQKMLAAIQQVLEYQQCISTNPQTTIRSSSCRTHKLLKNLSPLSPTLPVKMGGTPPTNT